jgi:hypothetical protein
MTPNVVTAPTDHERGQPCLMHWQVRLAAWVEERLGALPIKLFALLALLNLTAGWC